MMDTKTPPVFVGFFPLFLLRFKPAMLLPCLLILYEDLTSQA